MAEFTMADLTQLVLKPRNMSFGEAAAVPLTILTRWQALHIHVKLQAGQKLLVTGAASRTGSFAVQIGRGTGATVIGTASSSESFDLLKDLGADEIFNHKTTTLERAVRDVDVVLDTLGTNTLNACLRVLKKDGIVININHPDCGELAAKMDRRGMFCIIDMDATLLNHIAKLLESGIFCPVVDSVYPFEKAREAFVAGQADYVHVRIVPNCSAARRK